MKGHLAAACRNTKSHKYKSGSTLKGNNTYHVFGCENDRQGAEVNDHFFGRHDVNITDEDEIHFVYKSEGKDPYNIVLPFKKTLIKFEIDTSSGRTIISEKTYRAHFKDVVLEKTAHVLRTYSGAEEMFGRILVNIEYGSQMDKVYVYVVVVNGPTLLGRDILSLMKLNWANV